MHIKIVLTYSKALYLLSSKWSFPHFSLLLDMFSWRFFWTYLAFQEGIISLDFFFFEMRLMGQSIMAVPRYLNVEWSSWTWDFANVFCCVFCPIIYPFATDTSSEFWLLRGRKWSAAAYSTSNQHRHPKLLSMGEFFWLGSLYTFLLFSSLLLFANKTCS